MSAEQLLVRIDATTEALRREVRRAENTVDSGSRKIDQRLGRIDKAFGRAGQAANRMRGAAVAAIAAFGSAQLARGIQTTVEGLEKTKRTADALNVSFEGFQELEFAFRSFGLQNQDVPDVLQTINDRANDAANGMKSFQEDFALVNLEVDDLRGKNPQQLLLSFADAVASTDDRGDALAATTRILGDEFARELFPLLRQGSSRFEELGQQIRDSGGVMSNDLGAGAADAAQQLRIMRETVNAQFTRAVVENTDAITSFAEAFAQLAEWAGSAVDAVGRAGRTIAAQQTGDFTQDLDILDGRIENIRGQIGSRAAQGREEELRAELRELLDARERVVQRELSRRADRDIASMPGLFGDGEISDPTGSGSGGGSGGSGDTGTEVGSFTRFGVGTGVGAGGFTPNEGAGDVQAAIERRNQLMEEGARVAERVRTATEAYNAELDRLDGLLEAGAITQQTYTRAAEQARERLRRVGEQADETGQKLSEFGREAARETQSVLSDFLLEPIDQGFDGLVDSAVSSIREIAAEAAAANIADRLFRNDGAPLSGLFSSGQDGSGFGDVVGDVIGGFFADGGRPPVGRPSVVGERGPELFVPNTPGQIVSNEDAQAAVAAGAAGARGGGRSGGDVTVVQNINTPDATSFRLARGEIGREARRELAR